MTELPQTSAAVGFEDSWYRHSAARPPLQAPLIDAIDADVCIIGGGFTGLSAALAVLAAGQTPVILEAHEVGAGASGRNGGILGVGQNVDQATLERWFSEDRARALWDLGLEANRLVRDRIAALEIDCDLVDGELTVAHKANRLAGLYDDAEVLEQRYDYGPLQRLNAAQVSERLGTNTFFGGVLDPQAGHLHPLKLAYGELAAVLQGGGRVFEHSPVTEIETTSGPVVRLRTGRGEVRARKVIIACNGYLGGLWPSAARLQMPINNFVVATEPLSAKLQRQINRDNLAVVDSRFVVNYFHLSADGRLLYGGGESYRRRYPRDIAGLVRRHMLRSYPQLTGIRIDYAWGGTLSISLNRLPQLGTQDGRVYWAQAYSGHGVALAHLGGKLCAEAALAGSVSFQTLADLPHRAFPGGRALQWPALVAGMLYYSLLDRF
ncbi:MAG: FAD-binding oxidoreductase [Pseudomonadota bacterium]